MELIGEFEANPSRNKVYSFTKQELIQVANNFEIHFTKSTKKQTIKSELLKGLT